MSYLAYQESHIRVFSRRKGERIGSAEEAELPWREKIGFLFCQYFLCCQFPHGDADARWEWKLSDGVTQLLRFTATENIIRDLVIQLEVRKLELIANLFILLKG